MKCPKCQTENPAAKKLCRKCGTKLSLQCPEYGSEYLTSDKFCSECGKQPHCPKKTAPQELAFDKNITKIQRYLPKGITAKILCQMNRIEGERKQVTDMFCDMEGSKHLSERLGFRLTDSMKIQERRA